MLPFGVTIPATVPQWSEIPEGLMNNPVYTHGGAVGLGTALKAGRSQFRFPMMSQEFVIDIILPAPRTVYEPLNYCISD
jgi:hypothetical protein